MTWQPSASLEALQKRAKIIQQIRMFFEERGVLEVETPLLGKTATPDPLIEPFVTEYKSFGHTQTLYLQTSPEFAMKRLIAAGSGPIFQITKAFRNGEIGRFHNPEFTMLEWYRPGFDSYDLIQEINDLLTEILDLPEAEILSYQSVFEKYLGINPHESIAPETLAALAQHHGLIQHLDDLALDQSGWLDLLFSEIIQPELGIEAPTVIVGFPVSMAALAKIKIDGNGQACAQRFEFYIQGVELANGYHELTDAQEQENRFNQDLEKREALGVIPLNMDNKLLAALQAGLPDCSGVALGIDRLMMLALKQKQIKQVISFDLLTI